MVFQVRPYEVAENFWAVIAEASRDNQKLVALLNKMSRGEIIRFYRDYVEAANTLAQSPYIPREMSEDAADDIACWVVAQGERFYSHVFKNPDAMPQNLPKDRGGLGLLSQVGGVFFDRFDEEIAIIDLWKN